MLGSSYRLEAPVERRYHALRFIGGVYQVLAILALLGTVLAAVGGTPTPYGLVVSILIGGGVTVSLFAIGEVIFVFLGIEENTRRQANAMERWTGGPPQP
jgi:hypothetical protein